MNIISQRLKKKELNLFKISKCVLDNVINVKELVFLPSIIKTFVIVKPIINTIVIVKFILIKDAKNKPNMKENTFVNVTKNAEKNAFIINIALNYVKKLQIMKEITSVDKVIFV